MRRRTTAMRRRRALRLFTVASVFASGLVGVAAIPAMAAVTTLTLTGPTTATLNTATGYSGVLTGPQGIGVPLQSIDVNVDGTTVATVTTGTDGSYTTSVSFTTYGTHTVQTVALKNSTITKTTSNVVTVTVTPPAVDPTTATDIGTSSSWIYQGTNAPQQGVASGTIQASRVAVIHGTVDDHSGNMLPGVTVTVVGHTEYGSTTSRNDGGYDLAVNGGGPITLHYAKTGYLPADRILSTDWRDYTTAPTVDLVPLDTTVNTISANASSMQVAQGSAQSDSDGSRQATLMFPAGTHATMYLPNGSTQSLSTMHVRATEYTVGANGPASMPADLPAASGYTYAVDYSIDEATAAGATTVGFDQPIPAYTNNFLGFAAGTPVPAGFYDTNAHHWVSAPDGVVLTIVSVSAGEANVDVTGSGTASSAANLASYGITDAERTQLAHLYPVGTSLWRVLVTHFTPWDYNWPYGLPQGAIAPNQHAHANPNSGCTNGGSIIGCSSQTLGEEVPVAGTPFALRYDTSRVPGDQATRTINIGVTGATLPPNLLGATVIVNVAGRSFTYGFGAAPNERFDFTWDGNDVYGRPVYGSAKATIKIGYEYQAVYYAPSISSTPCPCSGFSGDYVAAWRASFALVGDAPFSGDKARQTITVWTQYDTPINALSPITQDGLGGWTLTAHNFYDPNSRTLYLGDGTVRDVTKTFSGLATFAGTGAAGSFGAGTYSGDGGPALSAGFSRVNGLAVGPDGSIYVADTDNGVVRRIDPSGTVSTFAGGGSPASGNGDGGPGTSAILDNPVAVAVGPDGSVYIADSADNRIRRVDPTGTITTFAGGGHPADGLGDNGSATAAALNNPQSVAVAPDGTVYVADTGNNRIRRINLDGGIHTAAGGGTPTDGLGDGLPGPQAALAHPLSVAAGHDGTVYIADSDHNRIRSLSVDGLIHTFAGTGVFGTAGDGGAATAAQIANPTDVTVSPTDGSVLIVESLQNIARAVDPAGLISLLAGNGSTGFSGDGGIPTQATFNRPHAVVVSDNGTFIADTNNFRIRRIATPMPGFSTTDLFLPSADGSEVYQFNDQGRQLRTLDALTGTVEYVFGYDGAGRLATITDHFGNVTTIDRDANGNPTGIDSPFGQHTTLHVNANGWLDTITDPTNATVSLGYGTVGLLTSFTDARHNSSSFSYDTLGRLHTDTSPDGKTTTLARTENDSGVTVTSTTAQGHVTTYTSALFPGYVTRQSVTYPNGLTTTTNTYFSGTQQTTNPDGTLTTTAFGTDPRWGTGIPFVTSVTQQRPSGASNEVFFARSVTLSDPTNPLTLTSQTDTTTIAGNVSKRVYNASTNTITTTSPAGRQDVVTLNTDGLPASSQHGDRAVTTYSYDTHGRLHSTTTGTGATARTTIINYGTDGYVSSIQDPLHTTQYTHDADGRVLNTTLPDTNQLGEGYDPNGNLTSVTPPGQSAHTYDYTSGDQAKDYVPPQVDAGGNSTSYAYNLDRQPTTTTLPDGRTITDGYDSVGRLASIALARGTLSFGYDATTGLLTSITDPSGESNGYTYDGELPTTLGTSGPIAGSVAYTYDSQHLTGIKVDSGATQTYGYDADGNITSIAGLTLSYDATNGFLASTSDGTVATSTSYDTFGEPASDTATISGVTSYAATYTPDQLGRISELAETIGGTTTTSDYTYDARGRLTDVSQGGASVYHYTYDANGNRLTATTPSGSVTATYDGEDRLKTSGSTTYAYNATGHLASSTTGAATTSYSYDELGHLMTVTKPDGTVISYLYDGLGRRVGKKVNGTLVQGLIYGDAATPLAMTDGTGAVTETFSYTTGTAPDVITIGSTTYRVITDHLGSPRLIVNTATGAVAEQISYDPYGNVISDTNPGFQPFGFAGGLDDSSTGLVHFDARDYDPTTGRWTTKDPTQFGGGDTNLYAYAGGDPINVTDPSGLCWVVCLHTILSVAYELDPMTPVVEAYKREINAVENGCSYWDAVKDGLEGTGYAAAFVGAFALGGAGGTTQLYRAVGESEARDIAESGVYRNIAGIEGKYFYPTRAQAEELAAKYAKMGLGKQTITSGRVANDVLQLFDSIEPAGEGPAYYVPSDLLPSITGVGFLW